MGDNENQYQFDWEVLLDATLTFSDPDQDQNNVETSDSDANNVSSVHTRTIKCFFSRVYLEDIDLVKMGAEEELADKMKSAKKRVLEISDEEKRKEQMRQMRKRCKAFIKKLEQLGFSHGYNMPSDEVEEHELNCYMGLDRFDDASIETYESEFKPRKSYNYHHGAQNSISWLATATDESEIATGEDTETSTSEESLVRQPQVATENHDNAVEKELSFEENKRDFDFGFDEHRDAKLIAKDAKIIFENDEEIMKYWYQRYRLFSLLKEGILMDREGWFSVTPETIALHVADRMIKKPDCIILDAFTGVGGNAIQFALRGAYVIAVDLDPVKLRCAAKNAQIYEVADRINFICGDFFNVAKAFFGSRKRARGDGELEIWENPYGVDSVFLSPPWGGPSYMHTKIFDLEKHVTPDGIKVFSTARKISPNIAYYLPKNTSVKQLISLAGPGNQVEIEQSVLNSKVKSMHAYYGDLIAI